MQKRTFSRAGTGVRSSRINIKIQEANKRVSNILMLHNYVLLLPKLVPRSTDLSDVTRIFHFISVAVRMTSIKLKISLARFSAEQSSLTGLQWQCAQAGCELLNYRKAAEHLFLKDVTLHPGDINEGENI